MPCLDVFHTVSSNQKNSEIISYKPCLLLAIFSACTARGRCLHGSRSVLVWFAVDACTVGGACKCLCVVGETRFVIRTDKKMLPSFLWFCFSRNCFHRFIIFLCLWFADIYCEPLFLTAVSEDVFGWGGKYGWKEPPCNIRKSELLHGEKWSRQGGEGYTCETCEEKRWKGGVLRQGRMTEGVKRWIHRRVLNFMDLYRGESVRAVSVNRFRRRSETYGTCKVRGLLVLFAVSGQRVRLGGQEVAAGNMVRGGRKGRCSCLGNDGLSAAIKILHWAA